MLFRSVRAAQANGLKAIGVLWGYGPRDELVDADALVASPEALAPALDALRAQHPESLIG